MPIKIEEKQKCTGCHACSTVCPKNCVIMKEDTEGFLYPEVDNNNCISCGLCEKVCPILNYCNPSQDAYGKTFAAINTNEQIRLKSSSGGVFTVIAEEVINVGGVVFGAAFDGNFLVRTVWVDTNKDLEKLRGSKYVQSIIGDSYRQAKAFLDSGRVVLFSGTPCQVEGLISFLNKKYENLITVDFICHGVPSPLVWKKYLNYRKNEADSEIKYVSFRNKYSGWKSFSLKMAFDNSSLYIAEVRKDPYMNIFLDDYCLRPSCYECFFKTANRRSDITLGDFWGVKNVFPEIDDDKGVSIVVVHSLSGKEIFEEATPGFFIKETERENCNYAYCNSVKKPELRSTFFDNISNNDFDVAVCSLQKNLQKKQLIFELKKDLKKLRLRRTLRKLKKYYSL